MGNNNAKQKGRKFFNYLNKPQIAYKISLLAILLFDCCKVTWEENYTMSIIEFQWAAITFNILVQHILVPWAVTNVINFYGSCTFTFMHMASQVNVV